MKIGVSEMLRMAARNGSITRAEAKSVAQQVKRDGVTRVEKASVKSALDIYADSFESGAQKPLRRLLKKSNGANGGRPSPVGKQINRDMGKAFGSGYGLTADQKKMLTDAGLKPGSEEYEQQALQLKIANYTNKMNAVSNIGKMLTDMTGSVVRNTRGA